MVPAKRSKAHTPLKDITNSSSIHNGGSRLNSSPQPAPIDRNEVRRQQYAQMDKDKKDALLQRRRETHRQKKAATARDNQAPQGSIFSQHSQMGQSMHTELDNMTTVQEEWDISWNDNIIDQEQDSAWLRRDDSYKRQSIHDPGEAQQCVIPDPKEKKRQRQRDRYAQLSSDKKDDLLKRRREDYQHKKMSSSCAVIIH